MSHEDQELLLAREVQLIYSNVRGFTMVDGSLRTWRGVIQKEFEFEIFLPNQFPEVPPVVRAITPMQHADVDGEGFLSLQILSRWRREFHAYQVILQLISLMKRQPPVRGSFRNSQTSHPTGYESSASASASYRSESNRSRSNSNPPQGVIPDTSTSYNPALQSPQQKHDLAVMKKQLENLKKDITKRDEELSHLRAREAIGVSPGQGGVTTSQSQSSFRHLHTGDQIGGLESEQIAVSDLMASLHEKYTGGEISIFDYSKLYKKYSRDLYILSKKVDFVKSKQ